MRYTGHITYMKRYREMHKKFWFENLKVRDHLRDLGTDMRILLK
jgi:hypothetical protein